MKKKNYVFWVVLLVLIALFVLVPIIFRVYNIGILPSQFVGALTGVFITAVVTAFLLQGQTDNETKKEKDVKSYQEKLRIYHILQI